MRSSRGSEEDSFVEILQSVYAKVYVVYPAAVWGENPMPGVQ